MPNNKNADLVALGDYIDEEELTEKDLSEMQAWRLSLRKAVALLPEDFVVSISDPGSSINFSFFIDESFWGTAHPDRINLRPSATGLPYWLTWEPFPKDGYSEEERMWIALHEFAHRFQERRNDAYSNHNFESPTTLYGCMAGDIEDDADAFALYVMFPDHLKKFPLRYNTWREIVGREYVQKLQMPNSVKSKLTDPIDGCKQYDEKMELALVKKFSEPNVR